MLFVSRKPPASERRKSVALAIAQVLDTTVLALSCHQHFVTGMSPTVCKMAYQCWTGLGPEIHILRLTLHADL